MKKILITGANGLLGQKIMQRAPVYGITELVATARGPSRGQVPPGYRYEEMDITDRNRVDEIIGRELPDTVIHTAAMTNVDACETERDQATLINTTATGYIADACKRHNIHLIHLSTDFIFNGEEGPYKEDAAPDPLSHYGHTKLKAEQLVMQLTENWCIIRTVLVYGVTPGISRSNIVLWARKALMEKQKISVVNDQVRSPTLAEDLADGCLLAATKGAQGIYHISGPDQMNILELVKRVAAFFSLDAGKVEAVSSGTLNQPARRPPVTGFVIDKAVRELGYRPHHFEEGLAIVQDQLKD